MYSACTALIVRTNERLSLFFICLLSMDCPIFRFVLLLSAELTSRNMEHVTELRHQPFQTLARCSCTSFDPLSPLLRRRPLTISTQSLLTIWFTDLQKLLLHPTHGLSACFRLYAPARLDAHSVLQCSVSAAVLVLALHFRLSFI